MSQNLLGFRVGNRGRVEKCGSGHRECEASGPSEAGIHEEFSAESAVHSVVPAPGEILKNPEWHFAALLARFGVAISRALEVGARQTGLTGTQISALYFARFTRPEFATVGGLARVLGVSHVTVVRSIGPLIERGYLKRETGRDRRTTRLVVTELGAASLEAAFWQWQRLLFDLASEIPPRVTENLAEPLMSLTRELTANLGISDFGICARCDHLARPDGQQSSDEPLAPKCRRFDVPMMPEDMELGCPHIKPVDRGLPASPISNPELPAPH